MFAKSIIGSKKGTPQGTPYCKLFSPSADSRLSDDLGSIREFPHDSRRGTFGKGAR